MLEYKAFTICNNKKPTKKIKERKRHIVPYMLNVLNDIVRVAGRSHVNLFLSALQKLAPLCNQVSDSIAEFGM